MSKRRRRKRLFPKRYASDFVKTNQTPNKIILQGFIERAKSLQRGEEIPRTRPTMIITPKKEIELKHYWEGPRHQGVVNMEYQLLGESGNRQTRLYYGQGLYCIVELIPGMYAMISHLRKDKNKLLEEYADDTILWADAQELK